MSESSFLFDTIQATGHGAKAIFVNKATKGAAHGIHNVFAGANEPVKTAAHGIGHGLKVAAVNKGTKAAGRGFAEAFKWANGHKALEDRGMKRRDITEEGGTYLAALLGAQACWLAPAAVGVFLAPVIGPFAIPVAIAASFAGAATPSRIQAAYRISKYNSHKNKARKHTLG